MSLVERLRLWCPPEEPPTDEAADEIERLTAPMEKCELVENEVTGLHNTADLYRIAELEKLYDAAVADRVRMYEENERLRAALKHTSACNNERLRLAGIHCDVCDKISEDALREDEE